MTILPRRRELRCHCRLIQASIAWAVSQATLYRRSSIENTCCKRIKVNLPAKKSADNANLNWRCPTPTDGPNRDTMVLPGALPSSVDSGSVPAARYCHDVTPGYSRCCDKALIQLMLFAAVSTKSATYNESPGHLRLLFPAFDGFRQSPGKDCAREWESNPLPTDSQSVALPMSYLYWCSIGLLVVYAVQSAEAIATA